MTSKRKRPGSGKARPCVYKNRKFPSEAALARAIGVTPPAIRNSRLRGHPLESVGKMFKRVGPITIRDNTYPTPEAAAAAHGVSVNAIYQARLRGTLDNVGARARR